MKRCCQVRVFETNNCNRLDVVIYNTHRVQLYNGNPRPKLRTSGLKQADNKIPASKIQPSTKNIDKESPRSVDTSVVLYCSLILDFYQYVTNMQTGR
jgi:hypothetical protein